MGSSRRCQVRDQFLQADLSFLILSGYDLVPEVTFFVHAIISASHCRFIVVVILSYVDCIRFTLPGQRSRRFLVQASAQCNPLGPLATGARRDHRLPASPLHV
jgi:hypothetical protein